MKKLVLLFAALLVAGCGEKSSSEGSESVSENPTPSNESAKPSGDTAKPIPAEPPSEEPSGTQESLSDTDVERLLKKAVARKSLEERVYQNSEPYSGWVKEMYDSGQVKALGRAKDGRWDGPHREWHENGQKAEEGTYKDAKLHGFAAAWHKTGQKMAEATWKEGKRISAKYWNSKGEEVETADEAKK